MIWGGASGGGQGAILRGLGGAGGPFLPALNPPTWISAGSGWSPPSPKSARISARLKSLDLGRGPGFLPRCLSQLSELVTLVLGSALGRLQVEVWQVLA